MRILILTIFLALFTISAAGMAWQVGVGTVAMVQNYFWFKGMQGGVR